MLAGYSGLFLKDNGGTLTFLINKVSGPISKDSSLPNKCRDAKTYQCTNNVGVKNPISGKIFAKCYAFLSRK